MAVNYRPVNRDQGTLLPIDMREWLPEDHLVWWILAAVEQMDTTAFAQRPARRKTTHSRAGQPGYDPDMLLGLLIYAYAVGQRSSRGIERDCRIDVAYRVLCAQDVPDHTVIARFRSEHKAALVDFFSQVLLLCARAGMVKVGAVALDGTKIAANASHSRSLKEGSLRKMSAALAAEQRYRRPGPDAGRPPAFTAEDAQKIASAAIAESAAVDENEDHDRSLHNDLRGPQGRDDSAGPGGLAARVEEALAQIDAEHEQSPTRDMQLSRNRLAGAEARYDREFAAAKAMHERWAAKVAAGAAVGRGALKPLGQTLAVRHAWDQVLAAREAMAAKKARQTPMRRNLTDLDSRLMPMGSGWGQCYNNQLVASTDHIILAAEATNATSDVRQYQHMIAKTVAALDALAKAGADRGPIGVVLADAGYSSTDNLAADGPDRLIPSAAGQNAQRKAKSVVRHKFPDEDADALTVMDYCLSTPGGVESYRRRRWMIEPVNAHLKDRRGLRRFSMRGLDAVNSELHFASAVTNLLRVFTVKGFGGLATA